MVDLLEAFESPRIMPHFKKMANSFLSAWRGKAAQSD
jgi:hypothetical protein